ncbi:nitrilase/cyanide hydratase and apolipoprotein N-acyltransferase [Stutzerimonas stutzeri B1SMN1]|nr:nitrilase/cyanide hydratase and apolipoprotein N-acyltransferase [Stutzerimonas stutzeri B1SMN1]
MSNNRKFRAAVVQTLAHLGDVRANIELVERYTEEAVRQGAKLIVFPECMNSGYLFDSESHCREIAETVQGEYVEAMANLCRKYSVHIASGFTELDPTDGKIYNSGLLLDSRGELVVHYHKQFLATHDQNWFALGKNGCPVVDTELGRIGLLICFDGRIPEITRSLALQGAEVIVDMANFFAMDQADMWVPARAYENGVWFVAATKAGVERSIYYPGGSMIVSPQGRVEAYVPQDTHGVVSFEVDPDAARDKSWQHGGDKFADRRPAAYGLIGEDFENTPVAALLGTPLMPEQTTSKAAAVQVHATSEPGSLDEALAMISHTAKLGAKVLALPQYFGLETWLPDATELKSAATHTPALLDKLSTIASEYSCAIIAPVIEMEGDTLVSVAVLIGPDGEVIGRQHQIHLEPEVRDTLRAGSAFKVFETPFGRIGMLIGHDGLYPESARVLTLLGADVITWSSAWREPAERKLLVVPKAEDNRVFVVCANRTDGPYPGGSLVVGPTGFPQWDLDVASPRVLRHGAVMPSFMNLALARQKSMIPKVDMVRNRIVSTYAPIVAS